MATKNLPIGTQVVTSISKDTPKGRIRRGSVGVIKEVLSSEKFLVRLPDEREIEFSIDEIDSARDSFRAEHIETPLVYDQIVPFIEFEFIAGSTAYGMNIESSDEDVMGCYVLPITSQLGFKKYQETVNCHKPDAAYHEIKKLMQLACKGNPNVMELGEISKMKSLIRKAPTNEYVLEMFDKWYDLFLSKHVFKAYQGYAMSQFKKIEADLRNHEEIRWKHAGHLLRLLWSGIQCLRTGRIVVRPKDVDEGVHNKLMDVRHGRISLEKLRTWRLELEVEFQTAFDACDLPDEADIPTVDALLTAMRLREAKAGIFISV